MKWFVVYSLLAVFDGHAYEGPHVIDCQHDGPMGMVEKLLDWFSAEHGKISNAPCKVNKVPTQEEMIKYIQEKSEAGPPSNAVIHEVKFKEENKILVDAFNDFTTAYDTFGILINKETQKKIQTEYKINPACEKAICAMEKIWGKDLSIRMLYIKLKHGFNTSELAFENADRFKLDEIDDVLMGLEDLPSHLIPMAKKNQPIMRFKRGKTLAMYKGSTMANAVVMLFDAWDKESPARRQYTVFHEMGHNIGNKLNHLEETPEWLDLSTWIKKGDKWEPSSEGCFISKYAMGNPWEDFAESLSAYRYDAHRLKNECPKKYDFLKEKVFNQIEYTDVESCSPLPRKEVKEIHELLSDNNLNDIGKISLSEKLIEDNCGETFTAYPPREEDFSSCLLKIHAMNLTPEMSQKFSDALKEKNIKDVSSNRSLIQEGLVEFMMKENVFREKASKSLTKIKETLKDMATRSFTKANPEGFGGKGITSLDYRWTSTLKGCGGLYFLKKSNEVIECQLKQIIKNDKDKVGWNDAIFPHYKTPSIFTKEAEKSLNDKREEILIEHLKKQDITKRIATENKKRFLKDIEFLQAFIQVQLNKDDKWETLSPAQFCRKTYGSSTSWTQPYGIPIGEKVPFLYEKCVEAQSRRSRRFAFDVDQWSRIITDLF